MLPRWNHSKQASFCSCSRFILFAVFVSLHCHSPFSLGAAEAVKDTPTWTPPVQWMLEPSAVPDSDASSEAGMKPYTETIPGSDAKFEMVPIPGGKFLMGSPANEDDRAEDEGPQVEVEIAPFWMGKCEVTWDEYELWAMGLSKQRRRQVLGQESHAIRRTGRRHHDSHQALSRHDVRHGPGRLSRRLHDAVGRQDVLQVALGQDRPLLSAADRGRVGIRLPSGNHRPPTASATTPRHWTTTPGTSTTATSPTRRSARRSRTPGASRHARQRGRVGAGPVCGRCLRAARSGSPVKNPVAGPDKDLSRAWCEADPGSTTRRRCVCAARVASSPDWKSQDPQLPQSIWYFTDADFVGFRVVRPLDSAFGRGGADVTIWMRLRRKSCENTAKLRVRFSEVQPIARKDKSMSARTRGTTTATSRRQFLQTIGLRRSTGAALAGAISARSYAGERQHDQGCTGRLWRSGNRRRGERPRRPPDRPSCGRWPMSSRTRASHSLKQLSSQLRRSGGCSARTTVRGV